MRVAAIIPARGESKSVPFKNMRLLHGRPLLWYTLKAAKGATLLDRVIVTTDDKKIALFARANGFEVCGRPKKLAQGESGSMIRTVNHCINKMELGGHDAILLLQPTCPLRVADDIDEAISLFAEEPHADSVISFVPVEGMHPARMRLPGSDGYMWPLDGWQGVDTPGASRQSYKPVYIRAGCIYLTRTEVLQGGSFEGERCVPLFVNPKWHANIDTEPDFGHAQYLIGEREKATLKGEFVCTTRFTRAVSDPEMSS